MIPLSEWLAALPEDPTQRPGRLGYMQARPPVRCWIDNRMHWLWAAFQKTAVVSKHREGDRSTLKTEGVMVDPSHIGGLVFFPEGDVKWHPGSQFKRKTAGGRPKDYVVPDVGATR